MTAYVCLGKEPRVPTNRARWETGRMNDEARNREDCICAVTCLIATKYDERSALLNVRRGETAVLACYYGPMGIPAKLSAVELKMSKA